MYFTGTPFIKTMRVYFAMLSLSRPFGAKFSKLSHFLSYCEPVNLTLISLTAYVVSCLKKLETSPETQGGNKFT